MIDSLRPGTEPVPGIDGIAGNQPGAVLALTETPGWLLPRGHGDVLSPSWGDPGHDAWAGLFESPVLGLLEPMMSPAKRGEITFACNSTVIIGNAVVEVASDRWVTAAGEGARAAAGPDQLLEAGAGPVSGLLVMVVTVAGGDGPCGDGHGPASVAALRGTAAGAAVPQGLAVGAGDSEEPASGGMPGGGTGQRPGGIGVQWAVSGGGTRRVGHTEQRGQRDSQVHRPSERRHHLF